MRRSAPSLALPALFALAACSAAPIVDPNAPDQDYVFVFMKSGEKTEAAPGDLQALLGGHFDYVARLFEQGDLVLAGSFTPPRADPELRAMAVFDTADVAAATALAAADPAVEFGAYHAEVYPWHGSAGLRHLPELDRELRAGLTPDASPEATTRPYVMVSSDDADRAARAIEPLRAKGKVAFFGRFGGELEGHALFSLIARDEKEAAALLETTGPDAPEWRLHPWFGPQVLTELAR